MMLTNLVDFPEGLAYAAVFLAAAVEGEVVFVSACVLVSLGHLRAAGVLVAGALGGSVGDQFFFYACRGKIRSWLQRFPLLARRQESVIERVQKNAVKMVLACRFLPGLRIAIPVACACAQVSPARFSICSVIGSFAWAGAILLVITRLGPQAFSQFGFEGWGTSIVPALSVLGFLYWLGRIPASQSVP